MQFLLTCLDSSTESIFIDSISRLPDSSFVTPNIFGWLCRENSNPAGITSAMMEKSFYEATWWYTILSSLNIYWRLCSLPRSGLRLDRTFTKASKLGWCSSFSCILRGLTERSDATSSLVMTFSIFSYRLELSARWYWLNTPSYVIGLK